MKKWLIQWFVNLENCYKGLEMSNEVLSLVKSIIDKNELDANILRYVEEYEDYGHVDVEVKREDYEKALMIDCFFDNFSIHWHQQKPEMLMPEVGDLVLIWDQHSFNDENSDIGLISSKFEQNGEIHYGCRYIFPSLNNEFLSNTYDFHLTEENYGGDHISFLKILNQEEAISHLTHILERSLEDAIQEAKNQFECSLNQLPKLLNCFSEGTKINCDKFKLGKRAGISLKITD